MIGIKLSPGIEPGLVDSKSTVMTSRPRKLDYNVKLIYSSIRDRTEDLAVNSRTL